MGKNDDAIPYLQQLSKNLHSYSSEVELGKGFLSSKTRLAETDKEARVNARVDAMVEGKNFDESGTPPEELETREDDMAEEFIKRALEDIFGV
jgi:hypothetical protein